MYKNLVVKLVSSTAPLALAVLLVHTNACGPVDELADDIGSAESVFLNAGDLWERGTGDSSAIGVQSYGSQLSSMTWVPIKAGTAKVLAIDIAAGETASVHSTPLNVNGNLDVFLYDGNPLVPNAWGPRVTSVAQSTRATGFVDQIYFTAPATSATRTYYVKLSCTSGTCAFSTQIGKGNATAFTTGGIYLNQRSFIPPVGQQPSGKCLLNNATYADGECMCAPVSAAMGLILGGKRPLSELRSAASDLFTTNNSSGGADRTKLMRRLETTYGYSRCSETSNKATMLDSLKTGLRAGNMVIFRSATFSAYGHYVFVRGYGFTNGRTNIMVDDPYGAWSKPGLWLPPNSKDVSSTNGMARPYDYQTLTTGDASIIICNTV